MPNADPLAAWAAEVLKDRTTHTSLGETCAAFGLSEEMPNDSGSKFDRALTRFEGKEPRAVAAIAEQIGRRYGLLDLEEAAVAKLEEGDPPLTEITRRDVARFFDPPSLSGDRGLLDLLRQIWPIDTMGDGFPFTDSLADDINQYMLRNDDWSVKDLFERLGALTCTRKRFFRLLEAALHPLARRGDHRAATVPSSSLVRDALSRTAPRATAIAFVNRARSNRRILCVAATIEFCVFLLASKALIRYVTYVSA